MPNEIQKQYDRLDDSPSTMFRMKEAYAVPDKHIRYATIKAFVGIKMTKGSSVQSHRVKMLFLVEKLEGLKAELDNDTYIDATTHKSASAVLVGEASTFKAKGKRAGRWKRKKGNGKTVAAPAAPKRKSKGKVRGSQRSKANDVCMHCQGKGYWKRECSQLLSNPDVCGSLNTPARGGYSYFRTFTDDHSWYGYVYLIRYKFEAFGRFKEYRLEVENQTENEILSQWIPPGMPQLNGVAERRNRTLLNMINQRISTTWYGFVGLTSQLDNDPRTYGEVMSDIDSDKWLEAMKSKMDSMDSNQVWTLVDPPKGVRPVGCKLVYKRKLGTDGEVTAFKARLVAKRYTQRPGVDFEKTYSPVAMAKSIRIMLAIAICRRVSLLLEKDRKSVVSKSPSTPSNKLPEAGTRVLMKSYGAMISSRMSIILVYTRRSVGARLCTLCFMSMTSCSLEMMSRC
ncbi:UNVERIFIED_CONTAM: hypothetical protein Slati_3699600 [Sesamum latifolium]|uniref:Reverse transcriptase Ty1/copia-type domain-containing protein n=1 Tax=Sesamum latifolium TaxID=2727402 RepID=A0AAW2U1X2_9LAMI